MASRTRDGNVTCILTDSTTFRNHKTKKKKICFRRPLFLTQHNVFPSRYRCRVTSLSGRSNRFRNVLEYLKTEKEKDIDEKFARRQKFEKTEEAGYMSPPL
ncbi:hypothetical protein RRG08_062138 [Elysia crispata]|uniref:Uncharacterized protein n=1 Tax=Elysia crispata TaxID=231223 RepID=A0AAE0YNJ5_9GAST|nr:hypothetical protein RRG08_062138 [Elysia crispata]